MKPLNLEEFAQQLRMEGNRFADEILELVDLEEEVAAPYSTLCDDIEHYAKNYSNPDDAAKALEWLGDRSKLLEEIEHELDKAGYSGDIDEQVKGILAKLEDAELIVRAAGWKTGDFLDALQTLADRIKPLEYDL